MLLRQITPFLQQTLVAKAKIPSGGLKRRWSDGLFVGWSDGLLSSVLKLSNSGHQVKDYLTTGHWLDRRTWG